MNNLFQVDENSIEKYFAASIVHGLLTVLNSIVTPDSGLTMLFNVVNSQEQCEQQNIVQYCFHQLGTSCSFFAVYS